MRTKSASIKGKLVRRSATMKNGRAKVWPQHDISSRLELDVEQLVIDGRTRAKRRCAFAVNDTSSLGENVLNDPDATNNNTAEESSSTNNNTRSRRTSISKPAQKQVNLRNRSATAALSSIFSSLDTNTQKMQRRGAVTTLIPLNELEGLCSSEEEDDDGGGGESDVNMGSSLSNYHQHQKHMAHALSSTLPQSSSSSFLQQQQQQQQQPIEQSSSFPQLSQQQSSFDSAQQFDSAFHNNSTFANLNSMLVNNHHNGHEWKDQTMDTHHHSFSIDQQQQHHYHDHDQQQQQQQHLNHHQQVQPTLQGEGDTSNNLCENVSSQIQDAVDIKHHFSQQHQQRNNDYTSSDEDDDDDDSDCDDDFYIKHSIMRRRGAFFTTTKPVATMNDVVDDDDDQRLDHDVVPMEGPVIDEML